METKPLVRRSLLCSGDLLMEICKAKPQPRYYEVTDHSIPNDARVVDRWVDNQLGVIVLLVESIEFTEDTPDPLPSPVLTEVRTGDNDGT